MKKLIYILFLLPLLSNAQGELNNNPPPQQTLSNTNANPHSQNAINVQDQQVKNIDVNDNVANQSPGNENVQKDNDGGKKPYCKECEEIKKLKQQQMAQHISSGVTSGGKKKNQYFRKFRVRTAKKMNRAFVKHKKNKPDYSCFNW